MKNRLLTVAFGMSLFIPSGAVRAQDTKRIPDLNKGVDAVDASVHAGVDEIPVQDPQPAQEPLKPPMTSSHWGFAPSGQPPATQYWPARASLATSPKTQSDVKSASTPASSSFQAGGQPPASISWSARPGDPSPDSSIDGNAGNPTPQLSPIKNFSLSPAKSALARPGRFRTDAPPLSTQPQSQFNGLTSPFSSRPQSDGFSTPFSSENETDGFSAPFAVQQLESNGTRTSSSRSFSQATLSSKRDRAEEKPQERRLHKTPAGSRPGAVAVFQSKPEKPAHSRITNKVE